MSGFVKLHRKIDSCPIFENDFLLESLFIYLIRQAEYRSYERIGARGKVLLNRGETWESETRLAAKLRVKRGKILRMLKALQLHKMIEKRAITSGKKNDHMGVVISICNYDKYQGIEKANDHIEEKKRTYSKKNKELRIKEEDLTKQSEEILVERSAPSQTEKSPLPLFSEVSEEQLEKVLELTGAFNCTRSELIPPLDPLKLTGTELKRVCSAIASEPHLPTWEKIITRVGKSRWLTGQEPGKNGKYFDTATVFQFLLSSEKRMAILEGRYDAKAKKQGKVIRQTVVIGYDDNGDEVWGIL